MIVQVRECRRCYRTLAAASGDDCPDHTLPCCGGKGAGHVPGCEQGPVFIAGRERARRREEAFFRAIFGESWTDAAPLPGNAAATPLVVEGKP